MSVSRESDQMPIRQRFLQSLDRLEIIDASDTEEIRLQKKLLLVATVIMAVLALIWGGIYYAYDQRVAAYIPWFYAVVSAASVIIFSLSHRYRLFRFSQLLFSLLLPFLLMLALGGFVNSSAVILFSLTAPLGALVLADRRQALRWFLAALGLIVCGIFVQDFVPVRPPLPSAVITTLFALNIVGTSVMAFVLLYHFVIERELAHKALESALQRLIETQAQLIQQEKMASLGELTAGIAHEIKNPLNFVNNFAGINSELLHDLRDAMHQGDQEEVAELLSNLGVNTEKIAEHGKRADNIVRGMMQHASGSGGQREATDINRLLSEYIELAYHGKQAQAPAFHVEIKQDLNSDMDRVEIVSQDIGRVLLNLLGNAFDAVWEHAASTDAPYAPQITVSTRQVDAQVEIRVADNGPGITNGIKEKLFEPFFTTKPAGSGTGLGLSLAYDIVTQGHGGTLSVESEAGKGATFIVTLPVTHSA